MKESIVIYARQKTALKRLTDAQKGVLFDALLTYAGGEEPTFTDGMVMVAFDFFRAQIDLDGAKYEEVTIKRREAGRQGGLAKKANATNTTKSKQNVANATNTTKSKQNVHDNDNDNDNNRETNVSQKTIKTIKKEFSEKEYQKPTKEENDRFCGLLERYNAVLSEMDSNINRVVMLTPYRVERLRRLVLDFSDEQIERGFRQAAASSYLNGRTKERERPADFDWIIDFDNFVKIYEGGV